MFSDFNNFSKRELWCNFFRTYHKLPELWQFGTPEYKDQKLKEKALNKLLEVYRKLDPTADVEALKRRINTVRTCYRRELRKVIKSRSESVILDEIYVPSLWYYDEVDFLSEVYHVTKTAEQRYFEEDDPLFTPTAHLKNGNMEAEISDDLSNKELTDIVESDYCNDNYAESEEMSEPERPPESSKRKPTSSRVQDPDTDTSSDCTIEMEEQKPERERRTVRMLKSAKRSLPTTPSFIDETTFEDDAAIFAASWATSYRKLTGMQKIFAKKAIEEILVLGQLDQLSFTTVNMSKITEAPTTPDYLLFEDN